VKERPILFNAPMVRALLDGSKTQTRRLATTPQAHTLDWFGGLASEAEADSETLGQIVTPQGLCVYSTDYPEEGSRTIKCRYGLPGDRLWVRETFTDLTEDLGKRWERLNPQTRRYESGRDQFVWYRADGDQPDIGGSTKLAEPWKPSIFMPRAASRITLEITGVRVERLRDISEADAMAEGVERTVTGDGWRRYCNDPKQEAAGLTPCATATASYKSLWESINGPGSWEVNPWVWVVEFKHGFSQDNSPDSRGHGVG